MERMNCELVDKKKSLENIFNGYVKEEFVKNYYLVDLNNCMISRIPDTTMGTVLDCYNKSGVVMLHVTQ